MNIEEIARKENIVPYIIGPQNYEYLGRLQAFANAVIKAHTEELIAGVGEPLGYMHPCQANELQNGKESFSYIYQTKGLGSSFPLYTTEAVAAAVAKAKQARDAELIAGVGEPVYGSDTIQLYTGTQVAGAVAIGKYALNADRYARERRIAELEAEAAKGQAEWQIRLDAANRCVEADTKRIAALESTLKVALVALEERTSIGTAACKTLIKKNQGGATWLNTHTTK